MAIKGPHAIFDSPPIAHGEWAGWVAIDDSPFQDHVGPLYFREDAAGGVVCAAMIGPEQTNPAGTAHGGFLMTLADMAMFAIARRVLDDQPAVTVTMTSEFLGPAPMGQIVRATGEVVRGGGALIFVRGLIATDDAPVMAFNGVLRRFAPRPSN